MWQSIQVRGNGVPKLCVITKTAGLTTTVLILEMYSANLREYGKYYLLST